MSDVAFERVEVIEPGLMSFLDSVKKKWAEGWELDPDNGPMTFMFNFKTGMIRDVAHMQAEADRIAAGKPSRAEILAKARAAKAAKQQEVAQDA